MDGTVIYIPCPIEHYPKGMSLITALVNGDVEASSLGKGGAVRVPSIKKSGWVEEEIPELKVRSNVMSKALMDLCSAKPEQWVPGNEIRDRAGVSPHSARAYLSGFSKLVKWLGHKKGDMPYKWSWGPNIGPGYASEMHYKVTAEMAQWWNDAPAKEAS